LVVDAVETRLILFRHDISPKMWTETYLSGVLRAILYSNEESFRISGYVRLNPIPNLENESKLTKGLTLGSKPEVQIATTVNNHLTNALGKYINAYGSYSRAVELFEKLREKDNKVDVLLAQTRIDMSIAIIRSSDMLNKIDNDIEGITILCDDLLLDPLDHEMLLAQTKFLASRGRDDLALSCAKRAVDAAPSEFTTWAALTDAYISAGDYEAVFYSSGRNLD
jgi:tetratricopeptide (TPR) repeat protein